MKIIAHVLIHNFHITAARAEDPGLAGVPVAVMKKNRVLDCSPEAAVAGVLPGLTRRHAVQACPGIKFIEHEANTYTRRLSELAAKCYNFSPRIESLNENEVFIDISGKRPPTIRILCNFVRELIPCLGSSATVSLAPNRLLARAATLAATPAPPPGKKRAVPGLLSKVYDIFHLHVVKPETAPGFVSWMPVELMWPLEGTVIKRLKSLGLKSFSDIRAIPLTMLHREFGALAPLINEYSFGIDKTNIPVWRPPAGIVYHAYCQGTASVRLDQLVKEAAVEIGRSLRERGESYRELSLSIFFEDGRTITKTSSFTRGKFDTGSVFHDCINLLNKIKTGGGITEITITAGRFETSGHSQLSFFADPKTLSLEAGRNKELIRVCKNLAARYAPGIITLGKSIPVSRREQMLMFVDPLRSS